MVYSNFLIWKSGLLGRHNRVLRKPQGTIETHPIPQYFYYFSFPLSFSLYYPYAFFLPTQCITLSSQCEFLLLHSFPELWKYALRIRREKDAKQTCCSVDSRGFVSSWSNLGSLFLIIIDVLTSLFFVVETVLCIAQYLAASLTSTH